MAGIPTPFLASRQHHGQGPRAEGALNQEKGVARPERLGRRPCGAEHKHRGLGGKDSKHKHRGLGVWDSKHRRGLGGHTRHEESQPRHEESHVLWEVAIRGLS